MGQNKFTWPLINDNITDSDKYALIDWLREPNVRFTQSKYVRKFEEAWSKWLGVEHSVFVNSGASANYIMASILKEIKGVGEVIVPPIGWVSDVAPIVNLGMTPVFVDVDMHNMAISAENIKNAITDKTIGITLVHALGFNGLTDEILKIAKEKDLILIEDCCESHAARHNGELVGTHGLMSNFSFYFGHHITTVEGGMVCTNDKKIYELAKMFRSHGMIREGSDATRDHYARKYPDLNPLFTFAVPGYNLRNTEFNAVLGLHQLKRLDQAAKVRSFNLGLWLEFLDSEKYYTNFNFKGNSNFALPLILWDKNKRRMKNIEKTLQRLRVEYRIGTAGGGNQARQPYLEKYDHKIVGNLNNANHIHDFGLYIGNHTDLTETQITQLCEALNDC
jgi:CDP-6-deoxy-D-xylo-4-hexulose-3-dehydrase